MFAGVLSRYSNAVALRVCVCVCCAIVEIEGRATPKKQEPIKVGVEFGCWTNAVAGSVHGFALALQHLC